VQVLHQHDHRTGLVQHELRHGVRDLALEVVAGRLDPAPAGQREEARELRIHLLDLPVPDADLGRELLLGDVRRIVRCELEEVPQHREHRVVGHELVHRRAAALEEADRAAVEPAPELVEQPRLAAAGFAHHRDDAERIVRDPPERDFEPRELGLAADQRRQPALGRDRHRRRPRRASEHLVGRDGLALATDVERSRRLDEEEAAHQAIGGVAHENGARARGRLQARRQVRRVADRRVVHLEAVPDRADDDGASVDADPRLQLDAELGADRVGERTERLARMASAARMARWGASSCAIGAPKSAIRPSPTSVLTMPPKR
jgi:hypothetical protein